MAELLGTISAIVGLVEFGGSVLCLGYGYISKVVRAPKEIRSLLGEVASLDVILDQLRDAADDTVNRPGMERTLESLSKLGILDACHALLKDAESCIQACDQLQGRSSHSGKNIGRRLLWPFKESETKDMLQRLRDMRETLATALTVDSAAALRRLEASQDKIQSQISTLSSGIDTEQKARRQEQLLKWLCPEECKPDEDLAAALQLRQANTCGWFFTSDIFESWSSSRRALLWIYGIPGCGKTIISSATIAHLNSSKVLGTDGAVGYFYCDHKETKKQTSRHFLMTIAKQLVAASVACLDDVSSLYETKTKEGLENLREEDYQILIQSMSSHFGCIFIIVDALDESQDSESIMQCLQKLMASTTSQCDMRILVTSRNSVHMEHVILPSASFKMALHEHTKEDILTYVTDEVKIRLSSRPQRIRDLETMIINAILDRTKGLFLQAKLQLDFVCPLRTPGEIKRALENLPSGLEPIYDQMLASIVSRYSQSLDLLRSILHWILGSLIPLPLESLAHAVAVRLEDKTIDEDNIADADDLTEMCGSFIDIDQISSGERLARVAHFSVIEFFRSDCLKDSARESFFIVPTDTHLEIALVCIKYLSLKELVDYIPTSENKTIDWNLFHQKYPLYNYAANSWMTHLRRSRISGKVFNTNVAPHLNWFLSPKESHDQYHLWQQSTSPNHRLNPPVGKDKYLTFSGGWQTPVSYSIGFGLTHAFDALFHNLAGPNELFSNGHTLLTWAVLTDRITMAARLLELKADPNLPSQTSRQRGMTPLHVAAETPNYDMAALLLRHGAIADKPSKSGATAFYRAVRSGSLSIMKMLKDAGADINVQTWDKWTPIFEAVRLRRMDALKLLLDWGAVADVQTLSGQTAWSVAMKRGERDLIELLKLHVTQFTVPKLATPDEKSQGDPTAPVTTDGTKSYDNVAGDSGLPAQGLGRDGQNRAITTSADQKKGTVVRQWTCCACGNVAMDSTHDSCPNCSRTKCSHCVLLSYVV